MPNMMPPQDLSFLDEGKKNQIFSFVFSDGFISVAFSKILIISPQHLSFLSVFFVNSTVTSN